MPISSRSRLLVLTVAALLAAPQAIAAGSDQTSRPSVKSESFAAKKAKPGKRAKSKAAKKGEEKPANDAPGLTKIPSTNLYYNKQ